MIYNVEYFYNFYINGVDITPLLLGRKSFSFGESIFSLYPTAMLELYLPSYLIEEGIITVGASAYFDLYTTDGKFVTKKEYKIWKVEIKASEDNRTLSGVYTLTFIHPWFFNQEAKCKAYGGTVQLVLYSLLADELYKDFTFMDVDKSIDNTAKYFRTYQNAGDFIENRLTGNYLVDSSPTFIYTNSHKEFHAHSFSNLMNTPTKNKLIDTKSIQIEESFLKETKDANRLIMPVSLSYSLNPSGDLWNKMNVKTKFLNQLQSSSELQTIKSKNSLFGRSGFIPVDSAIQAITYPLAVYLDNSEKSQTSIYSSFLLKQRDILLDQTFSVNCFPNFTVKIGEGIDLYLKKEAKNTTLTEEVNSIFYATYLIVNIRHIQINTSFVTQLTLARDIIQPKNKNLLKGVSGVVAT